MQDNIDQQKPKLKRDSFIYEIFGKLLKRTFHRLEAFKLTEEEVLEEGTKVFKEYFESIWKEAKEKGNIALEKYLQMNFPDYRPDDEYFRSLVKEALEYWTSPPHGVIRKEGEYLVYPFLVWEEPKLFCTTRRSINEVKDDDIELAIYLYIDSIDGAGITEEDAVREIPAYFKRIKDPKEIEILKERIRKVFWDLVENRVLIKLGPKSNPNAKYYLRSYISLPREIPIPMEVLQREYVIWVPPHMYSKMFPSEKKDE